MSSILWRRIDGEGMERCQVAAAADGVRLSGTTLLLDEGTPVEIRYSIGLGTDWTTNTVGVHIRSGADERSVALRRDDTGRWSVGDETLDWLEGATDPDFAWTPATNSIPLRRLHLEVGETAEVDAVFVPFPGRLVERRTQWYERLAPRRWRYASGDFETDLTTDENGFVIAYPGHWTAM